VSKSDTQKAKLALADTQQKLVEAETRDRAARQTDQADHAMRARKMEKIQADIDRYQRSMNALKLMAPADGTVNILENWRNATPNGSAPSFAPGDHIWPGATIMELPDLSAVHIASKIDETDRGQLKVGQSATVHVDAIPDREYHAVVNDVSILARIDYSTGWPPTKNFDLTLDIRDADDRLKPGMSAAARIDVGHIPNVLLVPAGAVFTVNGRPVVYRLSGRHFDVVPVDVIRRGHDQAAVSGAVAAGDHVALDRPDQPKKKTGGAK
jgi:RND family efflux transporter MFP subunit